MSSHPNSLTISCPHCARRLAVNPTVIGRKVKCPKCGGEFTAASPPDLGTPDVVDLGTDDPSPYRSPPPIPQRSAQPAGAAAPPIAIQRKVLEPTPSSGKLHVITERTGKLYKLMQLVGILMTLAGATFFFLYLTNSQDPTHDNRGVRGIELFMVGLPVYIAGRFLAWWHHG